jgi:cell division protein FtsB
MSYGVSKSAFDSLVLVFCLLLYGYLGWHYFYGIRSIAVQASLEARQADLRQQLEQTVQKRRQLEARVNLLRPENIDRDLLDEVARRTLNFVDNRELILQK